MIEFYSFQDDFNDEITTDYFLTGFVRGNRVYDYPSLHYWENSESERSHLQFYKHKDINKLVKKKFRHTIKKVSDVPLTQDMRTFLIKFIFFEDYEEIRDLARQLKITVDNTELNEKLV